MPALVVGGVTIPVAPAGNQRNRLDSVDRQRAFDNTYRASATGTAKREWSFSTPLVARAIADSTYEPALAIVTAQACSGDVLGGSVSCCAEITGWTPVVVQGGHYVVVSFVLHEV